MYYNLTYQYLFPFVDHVISHLMNVIAVPLVRFTIGCEFVQRVNLLPWMTSNKCELTIFFYVYVKTVA